MKRWVLPLLLVPFWAAPSSARTAIDGPYIGVLPCADCPGIRTELALERDAATGTPRRYWLRETYLDAGSGKRKRDFVARVTARDETDKAEKSEKSGKAEKSDERKAAETKNEAVIDERPAAARAADDRRPDGTGTIEATLDARSIESMGAWSLEPAASGRAARIVLETANGPRYFARTSERVLEALSRSGARIVSTASHNLQLQAGGASPLADPVGTSAAGIVTRDANGRLVLALCSERGAVLLTDGARAPSVNVALEAVGFARVGRAFLEVYGVRRGAELRVHRVARASVDLDCAGAAPAPLALSASGSDGRWSLRADADGVRLSLPATAGAAQRGSTATPLAWTWRDGRNEAASATLRSGQIAVRATPRLCRDTMANTVYGFAAELTYAGQRFEGCAWSAASDQP